MFLLATPLLAQKPSPASRNPLDQLHDQAREAFEKAGTPFSPEQEQAIALMIEDRRQASENLISQLMDYSGGPVQGEQQDRAVAGIKSMIDEFRRKLREGLTRNQLAIWEIYESGD